MYAQHILGNAQQILGIAQLQTCMLSMFLHCFLIFKDCVPAILNLPGLFIAAWCSFASCSFDKLLT